MSSCRLFCDSDSYLNLHTKPELTMDHDVMCLVSRELNTEREVNCFNLFFCIQYFTLTLLVQPLPKDVSKFLKVVKREKASSQLQSCSDVFCPVCQSQVGKAVQRQ